MNELSILAAAREAPRRDCLVANGRVLSYGEIAERVCAAIAALRARGVRSGERVALAPDVDLDSVLWIYALFELGCPAVLLHPRTTERERQAMIDRSRPAHLINGPVPANTPVATALAQESWGQIPEDRCLAVVFTSGTSGEPRGARLSRRAFIASEEAHAANLGWQSRDRWMLCMPPAHVGGLSILTRCLIARRCAVLSPGPFEPSQVIEVMGREGVTLLSVVPTMLRRLLAADAPRWEPSADLRAVLVGGAPFPDGLRAESVKRGIPALATYGCTEACSQVATQRPDQAGTPGCGAPLGAIEVRIERGEIQIRGDVLMDGYLEHESADSPFTPDRWFRTGDAGSFLPDGQLLVHGRIDDIIVTGGENVAPLEVEAWLETIPGIRSACVFAVPHEEWGEEVVAAIVSEPSQYDAGVLRDRLRRELAPYKRPKRMCVLKSMPLNRSGKIDRAEVARRCAEKLRPI